VRQFVPACRSWFSFHEMIASRSSNAGRNQATTHDDPHLARALADVAAFLLCLSMAVLGILNFQHAGETISGSAHSGGGIARSSHLQAVYIASCIASYGKLGTRWHVSCQLPIHALDSRTIVRMLTHASSNALAMQAAPSSRSASCSRQWRST
jgi:hypothetical protein